MKKEPIEAIFVKIADAQQRIEEKQKKLREAQQSPLAEAVGVMKHGRIGNQAS